MENNIQLFKHPEFGKVRVVMIEGEPWFVGKDVATALGYAKPADAIREHVPDKFKGVCEMETPGGKQKVVVINEAGMYKLVMRSKLESAEKFSDWVCGDVLISIRKTGSYSVNKNDRDPLAVKRDNSIELLAKAISELVAFERERLAANNNKIDSLVKAFSEFVAVERDRLAVERERFALGQEKFNFDNSEDGKIFTAVDMLIKLATLAGERTSIRLKLVGLATNLLVRDNFIDASDIIFKE